MTAFFDWVRLGTVLIFLMMMGWLNLSLHRYRKQCAIEDEKKRAGQVQMLETLIASAQNLKEATLAALWLKHAAYRAEEEAPPLTIKCIECGDIAGTAGTIEDIFPVAHSHVLEKYDELLRDVKRPTRARATAAP